MKGNTTRMVTATVAVLGGVAAISTIVAVFVRANSPKAKSNRLVGLCDGAINELERRMADSGVIHLRRSA